MGYGAAGRRQKSDPPADGFASPRRVSPLADVAKVRPPQPFNSPQLLNILITRHFPRSERHRAKIGPMTKLRPKVTLAQLKAAKQSIHRKYNIRYKEICAPSIGAMGKNQTGEFDWICKPIRGSRARSHSAPSTNSSAEMTSPIKTRSSSSKRCSRMTRRKCSATQEILNERSRASAF
jgi:hypothetical protein